MKDTQGYRKGFKEGLEVSAAKLMDAGRHTLGLIPVMQLSDSDREKFSQAMRLLREVQGGLPRYMKAVDDE